MTSPAPAPDDSSSSGGHESARREKMRKLIELGIDPWGQRFDDRLLIGDIRAKALWNYQRDDWKAMLSALATDGTGAMVIYRLMQWAGRRRLPVLAVIFNKVNSVFNNCIIGRGAEFGPRFVLIHATGVVINGEVRGGADLRVEHQVTIGAEGRRAPVLGDAVFAGSLLLDAFGTCIVTPPLRRLAARF